MHSGSYKAREMNGTQELSRPVSANGNNHFHGNHFHDSQSQEQDQEKNKQSRQLLIALTLLLVVLGVVIAKNGDFWFGSEETADAGSAASENVSTSASSVAPKAVAPYKNLQVATAKAPVAKTQPASKSSNKAAATKAIQEAPQQEAAPVVASNRVVLPPLDVEVVAGDKHNTIHPGSNVIVTEIPSESNRTAQAAPAETLPTNAAQRERLSAVSAPELRQAIDATTYPLLSQHSRVQGSVVLEAVIGSDGSIEGLRVLSGPSILTSAAQQAVRQWRFKPYLQNGQPVETKCRVTVNFSIRISDNPPSAS